MSWRIGEDREPCEPDDVQGIDFPLRVRGRQIHHLIEEFEGCLSRKSSERSADKESEPAKSQPLQG